jgi:pimeloyl-[acyl-carrier protein] methyl ester esterase
VRLVFIHGWALGPDLWDALAPLLPGVAQARVDLGFFGAPDVPALQSGDILVGHSMGLLWGLARDFDWAGVVAVNGFARFPRDGDGRGCVKPSALRAMRQALMRDPQACADDFRRTLGLAPATGQAQKERLMDGLDLLRDGDAAPLAGARPWLVLGAADDPLVPTAATRDLAATTGGALALLERGGHALPRTAPRDCAERITGFLRAHDF